MFRFAHKYLKLPKTKFIGLTLLLDIWRVLKLYINTHSYGFDADCLVLFYYTFCSTCFGYNTYPSSGATYNVHADDTGKCTVMYIICRS